MSFNWIPIGNRPLQTGWYLVGHSGHQERIFFASPNDTEWIPGTKLGWRRDPAMFGATHCVLIDPPPKINLSFAERQKLSQL